MQVLNQESAQSYNFMQIKMLISKLQKPAIEKSNSLLFLVAKIRPIRLTFFPSILKKLILDKT